MPITFGMATSCGLVELVVLVECAGLVECAELVECAGLVELGGPLLENPVVGPVASTLLLMVGCGLWVCLTVVELVRLESGLVAGLLTLSVNSLAFSVGAEWWRPVVFCATGGWVVPVPSRK